MFTFDKTFDISNSTHKISRQSKNPDKIRYTVTYTDRENKNKFLLKRNELFYWFSEYLEVFLCFFHGFFKNSEFSSNWIKFFYRILSVVCNIQQRCVCVTFNFTQQRVLNIVAFLSQ